MIRASLEHRFSQVLPFCSAIVLGMRRPVHLSFRWRNSLSAGYKEDNCETPGIAGGHAGFALAACKWRFLAAFSSLPPGTFFMGDDNGARKRNNKFYSHTDSLRANDHDVRVDICKREF